VKDLYNENYKTLKKEVADTRRWKKCPTSWTGRINIVKMATPLKEIHRFNAFLVKIPMSFYKEIEKTILKFIWKPRRTRIAKAILNKRTMLEVKQYRTSNYAIEPQ
jgi:hypothetical protein